MYKNYMKRVTTISKESRAKWLEAVPVCFVDDDIVCSIQGCIAGLIIRRKINEFT